MSKLTSLDDEEVDISNHGAGDRDTQKKQPNKDYVDKTFHAKEWDVQEGDLVLLEQKRQNKFVWEEAIWRDDSVRGSSCVEGFERRGVEEKFAAY